MTGEFVGGGFREDLWAFTANLHPWKGLKLQAGGGFEQELNSHSAEVRTSETEHEKSVRGLFRVGVGYEIELGKHWTIGPDFAFDMLKGEHVFVYGVTIGFGFGSK